MSTKYSIPGTVVPRPPLPTKWNTFLSNLEKNPIVKFQPIKKDGAVVYVGRIKVEVPPDENNVPQKAYVLRRYDTGTISLTTMWRAAFPGAKPLLEKEELNWVRANYDLKTSSVNEVTRLAGVWIPVELAKNFAPSYNLTNVINALANSYPEAESTRAKIEEPPPVPTHTTTPSGPNKRRKETHESPAVVSTPATPNGANGYLLPVTPVSITKTPTAATSQKGKSPATSRRSTPSRSVKPRKAASPKPESSGGTPRRTSRQSALPKMAEEHEPDEDAPKAPVPDPAEDIAESQSLVQRLKETYAQPQSSPVSVLESVATTAKRTREEADAPLVLNLDKSAEGDHVPPSERLVVANRRIVPQWPTLEPNQKAAAWGTLAFALGWGAT
ncbi:hypothetical protein FRC17_006760, partial [Serendipita sp. 399]